MLVYYYSSNSIVRYFFWGRISSLLSFTEFHPLDRVLEIGFGPGIMFPTLANVCDQVVGIDPLLNIEPGPPSSGFETVKNMCKAEAIKDKVEVLRGDGQNIPLQQETCDIVIAMDVLEHLPDLLRSLKEIARILKKNGSFLACIPMENLYRRTARRLFRLPELHEEEHFYKDILDDIKSVFSIAKMRMYPAILPICINLNAKKRSQF